jgi:hypothetical protein
MDLLRSLIVRKAVAVMRSALLVDLSLASAIRTKAILLTVGERNGFGLACRGAAVEFDPKTGTRRSS